MFWVHARNQVKYFACVILFNPYKSVEVDISIVPITQVK